MNGILVLAKPAGPTSHDMVALVRRLSGTRRVGHGGTLDPFATGVLPLFLGTATRMLEYHLGDPKAYRATVCFGSSSTTDDLEGELTPVAGAVIDRGQVQVALAGFRGAISQVPPVYSAIKVSGRRAYAMARAGLAPELRPRDVTISRLDLVTWDDSDPGRPIAILDIECSAGTYVRALARDLGRAVGSGAYLGALMRTASGPFRLEMAHPLQEVRGAASEGPSALAGLLLVPDWGLERLSAVVLDEHESGAVARGQFIRPTNPVRPGPERNGPVRLIDATGRLIGIGAYRDGRLVPDKVLIGTDEAKRVPEPRADPGPARPAGT